MKKNGMENIPILVIKKHSEETKKKIALSLIGKKHSSERRRNLSLSHMGIKQSEESKRKISLKLLGSNAPNWKGGVSPLQNAIRRLFEYNSWRISVFRRDDFTCKMPKCGHRGKGIEVNHIKLFSEIVKRNNIKTTKDAVECLELWQIENGITLCKKCHKAIRFKEKEYESLFENILKN